MPPALLVPLDILQAVLRGELHLGNARVPRERAAVKRAVGCAAFGCAAGRLLKTLFLKKLLFISQCNLSIAVS